MIDGSGLRMAILRSFANLLKREFRCFQRSSSVMFQGNLGIVPGSDAHEYKIQRHEGFGSPHADRQVLLEESYDRRLVNQPFSEESSYEAVR